jgi:MOSC domain-containing protein YiiM
MTALSDVTPVLLAGRVTSLPASDKRSAIDKRPAPPPWTIGPLGLLGDEQADPVHHGGADKALHHYPRDHYVFWRAELGDTSLLDTPGAFGENLSTSGWTEADMCLGDIVALGPVRLEVSHGRQPCWKLNLRFGRKDMARLVQTTGRTGWYYRVREPGLVEPGVVLRLIARPYPDWPLTRLIETLYRKTQDDATLAGMADHPALAENWRAIARHRLAARATEDWTRRLDGRGA